MRARLARFVDALPHLEFLLLRVPAPSNEPRYDRLDADAGLDLALAGKCLIEYPVVRVALPADVSSGQVQLAPCPVLLHPLVAPIAKEALRADGERETPDTTPHQERAHFDQN